MGGGWNGDVRRASHWADGKTAIGGMNRRAPIVNFCLAADCSLRQPKWTPRTPPSQAGEPECNESRRRSALQQPLRFMSPGLYSLGIT
jgi:hypothetical protein